MAQRAEVGVGLVGYGLAGRSFHAPFIEAVEGLRLNAIATSNPDRQARATAEHPAATVVKTADELVERSDVEVVVVVTPNRFHVPVGIRALAAGRHVVVDKPIAMDVPEAESLIEAGIRAGRLLSVYQNRRWDSDYLTVRRLIAEGALGPIDCFESRFERWIPVGDGWRDVAHEAGGPLRDLGSHLVDQSLILFGSVRRVWAQADRRRPDGRIDDSTFIAIDHDDGVRSRLWMSLIAARSGPRMRIRGLAAEYIEDDFDPQEHQLLGGMSPNAAGFGEHAPERWGELFSGDGSTRQVPTERGAHRRFYELFRDAVRGAGPVPVDPIDSLRVLRVLEAAEQAAVTGAAQAVREV